MDSLADNSPPGQAKGFGQCKDRVMLRASTIKPWTSNKNPVKIGLVSQDVTKSTSRFDTKMKETKGCSGNMQHASQRFAWQATRAHVDRSGIAFCGSLRAFAALLPAGLVLNGNACMWPGAPSRSNMFQVFSWLLPGLGLHASRMRNQDCRFYNPLPLQ